MEQRLEVGWDGMVYTRTQRNLVGGSMADIRGVYGRQAEAHQFPIQFAALALPILGDSRERERGDHPFRPRDGVSSSREEDR